MAAGKTTPQLSMIFPPKFRVAFLIFALALGPGCHRNSSSQSREQPPLSSVGEEIQRRGYYLKESQVTAPTPWDIATFRLRNKREFSFRANQPQKGTSDYFVRFWLFEETYDSVEDARHRLANLHLHSPDAPAEVNEYDRVMRSGFRVGTVVYFIQTDAIIFWDDTKRFAKEIFDNTQGAAEFTL
jgi:hypothetical protein